MWYGWETGDGNAKMFLPYAGTVFGAGAAGISAWN